MLHVLFLHPIKQRMLHNILHSANSFCPSAQFVWLQLPTPQYHPRKPEYMPTQSGRPGPAVAKQKGDMKVNPSTSHDPQSPPSSLSSSHCAQRQRGRSGCLGGISVLAQAWCVHGLTSNVTASSGVIVSRRCTSTSSRRASITSIEHESSRNNLRSVLCV